MNRIVNRIVLLKISSTSSSEKQMQLEKRFFPVLAERQLLPMHKKGFETTRVGTDDVISSRKIAKKSPKSITRLWALIFE
jgi:hypothetical protein